MELLSEKITKNSVGADFIKNVTDEGFDYLAIGNSITIHPIVDYWWGEWGMAATKESSDYYHMIVTDIEEYRNESINSFAYNFYTWEVNSHDRAESWSLIDSFLVPGIDLVTIQLSENVSDTSTFESDYIKLINHIYDKCGSTIQIIIDDFWDDIRSDIKKSVVDETGVGFVDLSDIRSFSEFQLGMGTIVYGADGEEHVNEHSGVAIHPNDEGMAVIADRLLEKIEK